MRNKVSKYKEFKIGDLFSVKRGKRIVRNVDYSTTKSGEYTYPVITSSTQNNGVDGYYYDKNCDANSLVCGGEASGLFTTYQPDDCWVMDRARIFTPLSTTPMNSYIGLYLATVFSLNQYRYPYGRSANPNEIESLIVLLPAINDDTPDFSFMEEYVKSLHHKPITTSTHISHINLNIDRWHEFRIDELFSVSASKDENLQNSEIGDTPYVASSSENNGITSYIDAEPTHSANTLTIARNGSVGSTFYQATPYCASPDDVRILTPLFKMTKYSGLFIKTVIEREKDKYAYGRKLGTERINKMLIKLPVKIDGSLDCDFMEQFIESLPYSDRI